ncbi:MAG: hypothetical protein CW338_04525 [Clostridiales bacterium]|nr:hypothetical protein [Clostridiales bacterium]
MKNRKMCRYLIALLAVAVIVIPVLFSAPSTAKADDVKYAKIVSESGGGVWFRETPGGNQLSLLSNGWVMQVLGEAKASNGGVWIHLRGTVSSGSSTVREGYVYTDYVVNLTPEETEVYVATHKLPDPKPVDLASSWGITTANVNLRASASTSSAKVDGLKSGTVVEIITAPKGTSSSYWYYVRVNSKVGYVNAPYIRVLTQSEAEKRGLITPKPEDITPKPDETTPKPDETTPKPDETTPAPINPDDYDTYVVVKIGSLNFRVGPSTSNSSLGFLNKGDVLPFYGYDSTKKWCHVYSSTYGCFGYVSNNSNYITVKTNDKPTTPVPDPVTPEPTDPDAVIGYVAVKNAAINVRKSNSISSAIVTTAKANTVLEMLGSAKDANYNYTWFKVRTPDGKTGYVRNDVAYQMNDWQVEVWKTTGKLATPTPASKETTPKTSEPSGYTESHTCKHLTLSTTHSADVAVAYW